MSLWNVAGICVCVCVCVCVVCVCVVCVVGGGDGCYRDRAVAGSM